MKIYKSVERVPCSLPILQSKYRKVNVALFKMGIFYYKKPLAKLWAETINQ